MSSDMYVQGTGKPVPKKGAQKMEVVSEAERLLETLRKNAQKKSKYSTIDVKPLYSAQLKEDQQFNALKSEVESFNEEILRCLVDKKTIANYNWKHNLYTGLRNLLKEIVSTDNKSLRVKLLEKASEWFYDQLIKKEGEAARPSTHASARPQSQGLIRPQTSQTQKSFGAQNISGIQGTDSRRDSPAKSLIGDIADTTRRQQLPSEKRAEILRDYNAGARTKHDGIDPPYDKLTEYERRLPLEGKLKPVSRGAQQRQAKQVTIDEKSLMKKKELEKAEEEKQLQEEKEAEEEEKAEKGEEGEEGGDKGEEGEEGGEGGEGGEDGEDGEDGEGGEGGEGGEDKKEPEGPPERNKNMMPLRKLYQDDKMSGHAPRVRDKEIPMETRSVYAHYVPSDDVMELAIEQRWRNAMHKKIMKKREHEEFVTIMNEWSYAKGRLEEEISRKNEALSFGSKFQVRAFQPRAQSATIYSAPRRSSTVKIPDDEEGKNADKIDEEDSERDEDLSIKEDEDDPNQSQNKDLRALPSFQENGQRVYMEPRVMDYSKIRPKSVMTGNEIVPPEFPQMEDEVTKLKIERIKKLHSDLIYNTRGTTSDVGQDGAYSVNRPQSLSIHDNTKPVSYRPFSAINYKVNDDMTRKVQMEEIDDVKKKLAKFKIKVPVKTLQTSIMLPEIKPEEKKAPLPNYGCGLMVNPFFKEKKKKGKKKKK